MLLYYVYIMSDLREKMASLEDYFETLGNTISQHKDYLSNSEKEWLEFEARIEKRQNSMLKTLEVMKHRNEVFQANKKRETERTSGRSREGEASGTFPLHSSTDSQGGSVLCSFIMPFYNELLSKCQEWTSPMFFTCHRGYRMCLKIKGHKSGPHSKCALLISLCAVPGDFDANLNWPALNNFRVEIINKQGGEDLKFSTGINCWGRPMSAPEPLKFNLRGTRQTYVAVECIWLEEFVVSNMVSFRVAVIPAIGSLRSASLDLNGTFTKKKSDSGLVQTYENGQLEPVCVSHGKKPVISSGDAQIINTKFMEGTERSGPVSTFVLSHYKKFLNKCLDLKSPAFYTKCRGYKVCLGLTAKKPGSVGTSKDVLLSLYAVPGNYDGELVWPAEFSFQIEIVNMDDDSRNMLFCTGLNTWDRPQQDFKLLHFRNDDGSMWGSATVNSLRLLEYIDEDMLTIVVYVIPKQVAVVRHRSEDAHSWISVEYPASSIVMPNYLNLVKKSVKWTSPTIFSHPQGYPIYLTVESLQMYNGLTYIMLKLNRVRGEFDSKLDWPVWFKVFLEIVNKRGGKNMVFKTGKSLWTRLKCHSAGLMFWKEADHNHVLVDCSRLQDFIENDMMEFKVRFKRVKSDLPL